jgi:uncharacterized protein (DUF736 family)
MKTSTRTYHQPIDVHAALARAHADRGEYIRIALAEVPALAKRVTAKLRTIRRRQPKAGAWA